MKCKAFIKLTIISIMKNIPRLLLVFSIFPVFISLIMGYFQKEQFTTSVDMPIMSIKIVDEDNSIQSKNIIDFLNSKDMEKLLEIDEEDAKYEVLIPKGYEDSLLNHSKSNIQINVNKKGTIRRAEMLGDIIDRYNQEVRQELYIEKSIANKDISQEEKDNLLRTINKEVQENYSIPLIETSLFTVKKNLTSYEHFSITLLSYMLIMVIMSLVTSGDAKKDKAMGNRIMATPITKYQYFNYNIISNYILVLLMNLIYILTYRFLGLSFSGSLSVLILIIFIQSILVTLLASFIELFLKKRYATILLYLLMMIQLIVGVMYPIAQDDKLQFINELATKYLPDVLITSTYRNYIIFNHITSIKVNLLIMLLVSMGLYLVSLLKLKWGGKYENSKA